ncbi:CRISPR-associated helicase Cas3' [Heliorestis acidaminivorans]|uniref:CRISPR-associated helicase Cas3 n=1 Tax=Heliorestis acidaminivorans TaxID=553427 RepID=A0A6I0F2V7_9FIRM|nr:CRISPR-associated helicase Cas3' [Heliorestis acidaminivorans]KAB2952698.1 CRISPR-associated helicase Cas3' [Heliorestis acidaminivorans]
MESKLKELFHHITDKKVAYDIQIRLAQGVLEKERVIFQSPTGSGKTWASILPFIYAKLTNLPWADRLIYAVPLRTLGKSLYNEVKATLDKKFPGKFKVTLQTGEMSDDPYLEGDIIFCTIDQLLSAYILHPYAVTRKSAPIVAGALAGSYIVFDEIHLLSTREALPTALDLVRRYQGIACALMMTATMSESIVSEIASRCNATNIKPTTEELIEIEKKRISRRTFIRKQEALTVEEVLRSYVEGTRVFAIFNTVQRAMSFYEKLKSKIKQENMAVNTWLLHSRFLPEDRANIEKDIITNFGPRGEGSGIVISTQVIEAGIDISAHILHTELAPANALIQRAGRVARFGGEGIVYIYDVQEDGKRSYSPYFSSYSSFFKGTEEKVDLPTLIDKTWDTLPQLCNKKVSFNEEKDWVDLIHGHLDAKLLQDSDVVTEAIDQVFIDSFGKGSATALRKHVRNAPTINIIIHHNPELLDLRRKPQRFSLHPSIVHQFIKNIEKNKIKGLVWIAKEREDGTLSWSAINNSKEVEGEYLLALSPKCVAYDSELGLQLGREGNFESKETIQEIPKRELYSYAREELTKHMERAIEQYRIEGPRYISAVNRWAELFELSSNEMEWIGEVATILHDSGKTTIEWQCWIKTYQEELSGQEEKSLLAHSDYDPLNPYMVSLEKKLNQRLGKKPGHAVQGALYFYRMLSEKFLEPLNIGDEEQELISRAIATTIARHHGAKGDSMEKDTTFPVIDDDVIVFLKNWQQKFFGHELNINNLVDLQVKQHKLFHCDPKRYNRELNSLLIQPQETDYENEKITEKAFLFTLFLLRRVRLADQASIVRY